MSAAIAIPISSPIHQNVQPVTFCSKIQETALSCIKEFATAFLICITVAHFTINIVQVKYLISALFIQFTVSAFFHVLKAYASYQVSSSKENSNYQKVENISEWIIAANFAVFSGYNMQILLHETGHALAAMLSYINLKPVIRISPFIGGVTQFIKTTLSPFGKMLGPANVTCLIVASGPFLTLICSTFILVVGLEMTKSHPQLSKYLIGYSLLDFISHAHYAYTAIGVDPSFLGHDFHHLSIFGLDPITAMVSIVAIPILIGGIWSWNEKRNASDH